MKPLTSLLLSLTYLSLAMTECQIDPLQLRPNPLVLDQNLDFIYSDSKYHRAVVETNKVITLACPSSSLLINGKGYGKAVEASCVDGDAFEVDGQEFSFSSVKCQALPEATVRYTERTCKEGGQEVEIGYELPDVFIRQIRICFDSINLSPLFSQATVTKNIGYRDSKVPRKFFEENGFYTTSTTLDDLYNRNNERSMINRQLGLDPNSEDYIRRSGELFVNRGHLTAKGDFVYSFQQLATFHYVNSSPQWASFNGGNWNELEISVRDLASSIKSDLDVYTGVYGITSLPSSSGRPVDLFLHAINGRNLLPIPQLFWKLIVDRSSGRGIVVIGVNNAYQLNKEEDVICEDISDGVSWFNGKLRRQKRNSELGFVYACAVDDFVARVESAPRVGVTGLLV